MEMDEERIAKTSEIYVMSKVFLIKSGGDYHFELKRLSRVDHLCLVKAR